MLQKDKEEMKSSKQLSEVLTQARVYRNRINVTCRFASQKKIEEETFKSRAACDYRQRMR